MATKALHPERSAKAAGLRYVSDAEPGIRRETASLGFRYRDPKGRLIRDAAALKRIRRLAVPPTWADVWICAREDGHLQATGRDERGRKQYRYHVGWRAVRDETKFGRMAEFGRALPRIRRRVARDLARHGLPRGKILATVVRLLETTFIRVGNEEYARANSSFGLTTLRTRQVKVNGSKIRFHFRGKSGVEHAIELNDARMAAIVRRVRELPGQRLAPHGRLGRRQRLYPRGGGRRVHQQGFPHLGRHAPRRGSVAAHRAVPFQSRGAAQRGRGHRIGIAAARQH